MPCAGCFHRASSQSAPSPVLSGRPLETTGRAQQQIPSQGRPAVRPHLYGNFHLLRGVPVDPECWRHLLLDEGPQPGVAQAAGHLYGCGDL